MRRNIDLKLLLFNNRIYGLTKASLATSELGRRPSPRRTARRRAVQPPALAIGAGATSCPLHRRRGAHLARCSVGRRAQGSCFTRSTRTARVQRRRLLLDHEKSVKSTPCSAWSTQAAALRQDNKKAFASTPRPRVEVVTLGEGGVTRRTSCPRRKRDDRPWLHARQPVAQAGFRPHRRLPRRVAADRRGADLEHDQRRKARRATSTWPSSWRLDTWNIK